MVFLGEDGEGADHVSIKEMKWKEKDLEDERQVDSKNLSSDLNMVEEKRGLDSVWSRG